MFAQRNIVLSSLFVLALSWCAVVRAESTSHGVGAPALIAESVNESKLVSLSGNTRPEANSVNDRGRIADSLPLGHMLLQLRRSASQEQQLVSLIDQLHNPKSSQFHQWLNASEFGAKYGLAEADLQTITTWLQSHGFSVNVVYPNGLLIDFSGTAGQVRQAFHTEIHNLVVNGERHVANMSDPEIPAALAPAIVGVVSLNDFRPHAMHVPRSQYSYASENGGIDQAVVPADLATIYNLNPLFSAGISGQGQTVVVIEDTDVYNTADWNTFRSTFGLSGYTAGSFTTVHPSSSGTNNCLDPGLNGDEDEAILDAEWASAAAPSAAIQLASCKSGGNEIQNFGGLVAIQNLINASGTPPAIMSLSYGVCETESGASVNAAFSSAYQQAVAEGVSVFVSSGDASASGCDRNAPAATSGIVANGWGSSVYNVSVGGTDFGDTYAGTSSSYWNSSNTATFGSAKSYVPEIPWNSSCASVLLATKNGYSTTYGSGGFCNSAVGQQYPNQQPTTGGGGAPSGCATGSPSPGSLAVSGSCAGFAKPSWQAGVVGIPNDGVRDTPDVSLFAASGVWNHFYLFCDSYGGGCSGAPSNWVADGGTSFATPIMAAIQALANQYVGQRQGNPNYVYYALAAAEYGANGNSNCNATNGNATATSCIFYDVTQGDMDDVCQGGNDCYLPSGTYGVLSTSNSAYEPAYAAKTGWDFATGIGTVNAYNLVKSWPVRPSTPTGLTATPADGQVTLAWTASSGAGGYAIYQGVSAGGESSVPVATVSLSTHSIVIGNLVDGTQYFFKVSAFASYESVQSGLSNEASATPLTAQQVAAPPTGLAALAGFCDCGGVSGVAPAGEVILSWNAAPGATGYNIYQSTSPGAETLYQGGYESSSTPSGTGVTLGPEGFSTFYIKVSSVNAKGEGPLSAEVSVTTTDVTGGCGARCGPH